MLERLRKIFTTNIALKLISLFLALIVWFYIVKELNKGNEEEVHVLRQMLPSGGMVAKKLTIEPILIGRPKAGYNIARENVIVDPSYCIVVGDRDMLGRRKYAYTMPIDVAGANKSFSKAVPLNPIAPGVYMEETTVQVTVPIQRLNK